MQLTEEDIRLIRDRIKEKYAGVAATASGCFRYPTGAAGLTGLGYPPELWQDLPAGLVESYCGVGNPFAPGPLPPGAAVLDVGCGSGLDAMVAARQVGPRGRVAGIDLTWEMVAKAQDQARRLGLAGMSFAQAEAEALPFRAACFEVVISNGAINLSLDKVKTLTEIHRVLKPGGSVRLADMILVAELPLERRHRVENWYQ